MLSFVTIVDPNYCTCEGENLAEGSQYRWVDDSCWRNDERTHDEHDSEEDERGREVELMFHNSASCFEVDILVFVKLACCCLTLQRYDIRHPSVSTYVHLCPPMGTCCMFFCLSGLWIAQELNNQLHLTWAERTEISAIARLLQFSDQFVVSGNPSHQPFPSRFSV